MDCSNCQEEIDDSSTFFSKVDEKPLCEDCFEHQCCICGCFAEEEDPTNENFCWFEDLLYCEECATHAICNQCGGICNYSCPSCDSAHDCECQCEIECIKCGETFEYNGNKMWDREKSDLYTSQTRSICDECWEELNTTNE